MKVPPKTIQCNGFIFSSHAVNAMITRNILVEDVIGVVEYGEIIAAYPNDKPYPSMLILNFINGKAIHAVVAKNLTTDECILITCYLPDPKLWDAEFKIKLKE